MKMIKIMSFVLGCLVFSVPADALTITPDNLGTAGGIFSFDLVVSDPTGITAASAFKSTVTVSGPGSGALTFDSTSSIAVVSDSSYWINGNSVGAVAQDAGGSYIFSDNPDNPAAVALNTGDIMASYAFTWDTAGDYTFTFDLDVADSFIQITEGNPPTPTNYAFDFTPGSQAGGIDYFTTHVPEPATIMLLALGGTALLKKRKRNA